MSANSASSSNNTGEEDEDTLRLTLGPCIARRMPRDHQNLRYIPSQPSPVQVQPSIRDRQSEPLDHGIPVNHQMQQGQSPRRLRFRSQIISLLREKPNIAPRPPLEEQARSEIAQPLLKQHEVDRPLDEEVLGSVGCPPRAKVARRNYRNSPGNGKDAHVPLPFPWGTTDRAKVNSLENLQSIGATTILGEVECKRCKKRSSMEYELMVEFENISVYLNLNGYDLHQRAPEKWTHPSLGRCTACNHENCLKPLISEKKKSINWLFMFLSETLGCCTLQQLKYFCKHNGIIRTGSKDRMLFSTYLTLCKQLDPNANWSFLT